MNDTAQNNLNLVKSYYQAFNEGETQKMLSFLHHNVEHEINQGKTETGVDIFTQFMKHMDECYKEELKNMTFFVGDKAHKIAAEFDVHGTYLKTDGKLPEAKGQKYVIRAGAFIDIEDSKIKRISTYYNLPRWIEMVK
ncbi:MAG: nuclear transport factor 2 family protein [Pseudobdellovibrio sp.]